MYIEFDHLFIRSKKKKNIHIGEGIRFKAFLSPRRKFMRSKY